MYLEGISIQLYQLLWINYNCQIGNDLNTHLDGFSLYQLQLYQLTVVFSFFPLLFKGQSTLPNCRPARPARFRVWEGKTVVSDYHVAFGTTSFPFASNRARSYLKVIKKGSLQTIKQWYWYVVIFHWYSLNWTTSSTSNDSFCVYTQCIFQNLELILIKQFLLLGYWSCLVAILQRVLGHFLAAPGRHSDFQASCTITAHEGASMLRCYTNILPSMRGDLKMW